MTEFIMNFEAALGKAFRKPLTPAQLKRSLLLILSPLLALPTVKAVCDVFNIKKDSLYSMLGHFKPDQWLQLLRAFGYARLIEHKRHIEQLHSSNRSRNRITIAVDDSGFKKDAEKMPLIGWIWNGVLKQTCMGTQALYCFADIGEGKARVPLDLRLCRGKGRKGRPTTGKVELAVVMIKALHRALTSAGCTTDDIVLTADSWFNAGIIYETARKCGFAVVMKGKGNFSFEIKGKKYTGAELKQLDREWRRSGQHETLRYDRYEAKHRTFGDVILTVYIETNGKCSYLISITPEHSSVKVIGDYKGRWAVEVFFRDAKQFLALGSFTFQNPNKIYGHFVLRTLSYQLTDMIRIKKFRRRTAIGQCARWLRFNLLRNPQYPQDKLGLRDLHSNLPEFIMS